MSLTDGRPGTPTKAELEEELLALRAEADAPLFQARQLFQQKILNDLDWWYAQLKALATSKNRDRGDYTAGQVVMKVLDKIMPDRKEISRGAASLAKTPLVQFNNVNLQQPPAGGAPRGAATPAAPAPIDVTPRES